MQNFEKWLRKHPWNVSIVLVLIVGILGQLVGAPSWAAILILVYCAGLTSYLMVAESQAQQREAMVQDAKRAQSNQSVEFFSNLALALWNLTGWPAEIFGALGTRDLKALATALAAAPKDQRAKIVRCLSESWLALMPEFMPNGFYAFGSGNIEEMREHLSHARGNENLEPAYKILLQAMTE